VRRTAEFVESPVPARAVNLRRLVSTTGTKTMASSAAVTSRLTT